MIQTKSGQSLSRICFGTLTVSPLQKNYSEEKAGALFYYAYDQGINFFDTAELYQNYHHLANLISRVPREDLFIVTKSYAYDHKTAKDSLEKALNGLNTDYIDAFLLHEQESIHTMRGHEQALQYLIESESVRYTGLSTHFVAGVRAAEKYHTNIEILHPIINREGLGIQDGDFTAMSAAIMDYQAHPETFVYGMKVFGGGHLLDDLDASLDFAMGLSCLDSFAIGMANEEEVDYNVARVSGAKKNIPHPAIHQKHLHIASWCIGCAKCVEVCQHRALQMVSSHAVVDHQRCVTCGYCAAVCPEFCLKVF